MEFNAKRHQPVNGQAQTRSPAGTNSLGEALDFEPVASASGAVRFRVQNKKRGFKMKPRFFCT